MAEQATTLLTAADLTKSRQLAFATVLTGTILVAEAVGGVLTGSLALLSDAGHMLADVFSLGLSLFALHVACRLPTDTRTYGYHRAEIFAALINGLSLVVIAVLIGREAWERLHTTPEVKTTGMLIIAAIGLLSNLLVLRKLSGHSHGDINLHSAYLHVLGDLLASVGVVIAAVVMSLTRWYWVDPAVSAAIGLLILVGGFRVINEASHILLQGVPASLDFNEIAQAMIEVEGVCDVHNLRIWAVCSNAYVLSAHVVACPETEEERRALRAELRHMLAHRFHVAEATLELECEPCPGGKLLQPLTHTDIHHHHHD